MPPVHPSRSLLLAFLLLLPAACGGRDEGPAPHPAATYDAAGRPLHPIPPRDNRPNVVVLLIDTLRSDAVRPGTEGPTDMPYLSRLASESVCFTQASSSAPWTLPSLTSLFTGLLPHEHGVTVEDLGGVALDRLTTWAEVMRAALGYSTAGFFGGFGAGMAEELGQGFDRVEDRFSLARADETLDRWSAWRDSARPFMLFLHTFEAHEPYGEANHGTPPSVEEQAAALAALEALGPEVPVRELVRFNVTDAAKRGVLRGHPRFRSRHIDMTRYLWSGLETDPDPAAARAMAGDLQSAYRKGLTWVDGNVERLVASLERRGLLNNTLLIVTGDHGEAFGEHGMLLHGRQLYDEILRVPLVLRGPAPFDRPQELESSVGLVDLFPSVLAWLGAPTPDGAAGQSFLPLLGTTGPGHPIQAEEIRTQMHTGSLSQAVVGSVRNAAWKYIGTFDFIAGTLTEEAYDLRSDPEERHNRAGPDRMVKDLPFDEEFCHAVERMRDRLWSSLAQSDWQVQQGYSAGSRSGNLPRPPSTCDDAHR